MNDYIVTTENFYHIVRASDPKEAEKLITTEKIINIMKLEIYNQTPHVCFTMSKNK